MNLAQEVAEEQLRRALLMLALIVIGIKVVVKPNDNYSIFQTSFLCKVSHLL